jgi:hypothetical protein
VAAGILFAGIQPFHPEDVIASVTTPQWAIVHYVSMAMDILFLLGIAGLYARQVEKSGWLGLAGFLLFTVWMTLVTGMSFVEAFILPRIAAEFPKFIEGWMGMFIGIPSQVDLGVLPTMWNMSGPMYILGPLLFGIATFRAGVLPRWAGAFLVLGAMLVPVGAFVPAEYQAEVAMIPVGLAMVWLGYALFAERRERASESLTNRITGATEPSKVA